jgi:hypothetical protein
MFVVMWRRDSKDGRVWGGFFRLSIMTGGVAAYLRLGDPKETEFTEEIGIASIFPGK